YPKGIGFEQVWATLDRVAKRQEETALSLKDTEQVVKEIGKRFGDFTNRFGEVIEYMIAPNLQDKLYDMGLDFQTVSSNFKVNDYKNNIHFQIDVFLQNGDTAMLVEIKTKLTISDINEHIKRMEKMRMFADLRQDSELKVRRTFLGAVAGVVIESDEKEYALNNGFYLIEPSGETFNITPPHNKLKEW
ncbi:MAG: hypothetical protein LBH16_11350, partial [Treponema sp.]|nr:hypothetical protein [Treponema sp.]